MLRCNPRWLSSNRSSERPKKRKCVSNFVDLSSLSAHLDVWAFEFRLQNSIATVASDVESVSMGISNQNISSIGYVDSVGEASYFLASYTALELASLTEHGNTVSLEVANIEIVA